MNLLKKSGFVLAQSCGGNPVMTTVVVMLFALMFNIFEAGVESVIFGHRFEHLLDIFFQLFFIGYAAYAVYCCALFNSFNGIRGKHERSYQ
ncbi:hypothetical protein [Limnohabitans sp.]|uniref:hypothetical protein n=1 Tax=Limnohabitans sp. TaxID=1907725 RepID=UPI00286F2612|nr:hypothetical protein [Limnohabitans sp.]